MQKAELPHPGKALGSMQVNQASGIRKAEPGRVPDDLRTEIRRRCGK